MPDVIATLRSSHDRLSRIAAQLTPDTAAGRAYPSDWSIGQVLSHLGSGAQIMGLTLEAGLTGDGPPTLDVNKSIWAVWDAKSRWDMAVDGVASDRALVERFEALTPQERDQTRVMTFAGEMGIDGLVRLRLAEHAVHTWDVDVALDPSATIGPETIDSVLDGLPRTVGWAGKPQGMQASVRVTTTDPSRMYTLNIADKASLEPDVSANADAELTLPAEALIRLVYGRLDAAHTPAGVATRGVALDDLRQVFPGF